MDDADDVARRRCWTHSVDIWPSSGVTRHCMCVLDLPMCVFILLQVPSANTYEEKEEEMEEMDEEEEGQSNR